MARHVSLMTVLARLIRAACLATAIGLAWLLLAADAGLQEMLAAAMAGIAAATADYVLRRRTGRSPVHLHKWLRQVPGIIASALADSWTVTRVLLRMLRGSPPQSGFRRVLFRAADEPAEAARRSFVVMATSIQPNSYVLGFNLPREEVLVHQLAPTPQPPPIARQLRKAQ